jgi:hypothetical protein
MVPIPALHAEFNRLVGRTTPESTFISLLLRHNWIQVTPDRKPFKANPAEKMGSKKDAYGGNG